MRLNAVRKYRYTADLFRFTRSTDVGGAEQLIYTYDSTIAIQLGGDPTSVRMTVKSATPAPRDGRLANIKDRAGNPVMEGANYRITSIEPMLSVFGYREGYIMKVAMQNAPFE